MAIDSRDNLIHGTARADTIDALGGNDTVFGRAGNDRLYGRAGVDRLYGEAGNDTLDGGAGADTMEGGAGNDAYYVDDLGDIVREAAAGAAGGTDTVYASVGFTLGANLEHLTLYGAAPRGEGNQLANRITGNAGANELFGRLGRDTLIGNAGADLLDGGADIDRMEGGAGNDAYYVDKAGDLTIETQAGAAGGTDTVFASVNRTLGANLEHLRLYGIATTGTGNALANAITGNGGNNVLSGLNGNDTLIGGLGNDTLRGGAGNDTLSGGFPDRVSYSVYDNDPYPEVIEDGKDTIDGGTGNDTLVFGETSFQEGKSWPDYLDPDMHIDLAAGTVTYLSHGFKQDKLISIENVTASSGDDVIVGSAVANVIRAGYGRNIVDGGGGNDVIYGGQMSDWWEGGAIEVLSGNGGNDTIFSNDALINPWTSDASAGWGKERLSGGAGNDRLVSGHGNIILSGGAGADNFDFGNGVYVDAEYDYILGISGQSSRVEDFSRAEGDKLRIDMGQIDEWLNEWWVFFDERPTFVGQSSNLSFGQLGYRKEGNDTVVELVLSEDWNGEGDDVTMSIRLEGHSGGLQASDFVFI